MTYFIIEQRPNDLTLTHTETMCALTLVTKVNVSEIIMERSMNNSI